MYLHASISIKCNRSLISSEQNSIEKYFALKNASLSVRKRHAFKIVHSTNTITLYSRRSELPNL